MTAGSLDQSVRLLLIEDNESDRDLIRSAFGDAAPLRVELRFVANVRDALTVLADGGIDVVFSDYSLPGGNGIDLLRRVREMEDGPPVVLITAVGDEALAVTAFQLGAAHYVVKNVGFQRDLPFVVRSVLNQRRSDHERERHHRGLMEQMRRLQLQMEEQGVWLRQALQESEALRHVGQTLAGARTLAPALDLITRTTAQLLHAQASVVVIRAGDDVVLASIWGALNQPPGLKTHDLEQLVGSDWREVVVAPLREDDAEIGLLWAGRTRLDPFSGDEIELAQALADMTALAIANVRAHEQLRTGRPVRPGGPEREPRRSAPVALTPVVARPPRGAEATAGPEESAVAAPSRVAGSPEHAATPPRTPARANQLVVPPFPAALARLLSLAETDDSSPEVVEDAIGTDPVLATNAIRLANAASVTRARPVASLREAVMVLGLRGVRNLAFSQFSRRMALRWGAVDQFLWERSMAAAAGMQRLLAREGGAVADDGYLCGLLHNVGAVALNNAYPERYAQALGRAIAGTAPALAERDEFSIDTSTLTARLVQDWPLPASILRVLGPHAAPSRGLAIEHALDWARAAAFRASPAWEHLLDGRAEPAWLSEELADATAVLALPPAEIDAVVDAVRAHCRALVRDTSPERTAA